MASMGWMLRRLSLLVLLIWVLDVEAEMIHNSCRDMKQYREDGTLETIGNVYPMVDQALNEAFQMTGYAKDTMLDVEEHKASNEVASNVIGVFTGLQGDHQRPVRSGPWNYLYDKIKHIKGTFKDRFRIAPVIRCGDSHLERWSILKGNRVVLRPKPEHEKDIVGFVYKDPIVDKWWKDNEHACHGAEFRAQVEWNEYVMVCKNAFERRDKIEIGSQRDINLASPRYANSPGTVLDAWATFLSYTLLHEFLHILFNWEDWDLNYAVRHPHTNSIITKAYGYFGSVELVFQRPHKVSTNVDNTGMFILAIWMHRVDWTTGFARAPIPCRPDDD